MRQLSLLAVAVLSVPFSIQAEPYRAIVTRTTETAEQGNVEVGLRYQGLLLGTGTPDVEPSTFHVLSASFRWGILEHLEFEAQVEGLVEFPAGGAPSHTYLGDIPVALQWTFLNGPRGALGLYARVTIPTGPSGIDLIPPTISDGTLDLEGSLLGELKATEDLRFVLNLGLIHNGTRNRDPRASFDVPAAVRYDAAVVLNVGERLLLSLELIGQSFFSAQITPAWSDNQHLIEVMPGIRYEVSPGFVLEAALGISLTKGLQEMQLVHPILGFTYEFGATERRRRHRG